MLKFSVLMSVYYKEKPQYLKESLESVFSQTHSPDEVVLVADGPLNDDLDAVINYFASKYENLKVIRLPRNKGLGIALNEGLNHCSFDYVARMDSDDICYPQRFEKLVTIVSDNPDLDVIGSWSQEFCEDEQGNKKMLSIKKFPHTVEDNNIYSRKRCPVEHPAVIFKKQSVIVSGSYQSFYLYEDYYLWARMIMKGAKFYNIQEPLLYFRTSDEAIMRRGGWRYACSELRALKEFRKMKFLSCSQYLFALITRFPVRILPNVFRKFIYQTFLRS